jgi:hypothetical protein
MNEPLGTPMRDENGKLLGYLLNEDEYRKLEHAFAMLDSFRQEAEERANGVTRSYDLSKAMTTAEVLAHIERLGREAKGGK